MQWQKNKIYLYGHSSGGTLVQFAAALDIRVKGVLASGSVGPIRETIGARGASGGDSIIPGLLNWLDTEDILALIAPRSFVGLSGDKDHIFPFSGVKKAIILAKAFFVKLKAEKKIKDVKSIDFENESEYQRQLELIRYKRDIAEQN